MCGQAVAGDNDFGRLRQSNCRRPLNIFVRRCLYNVYLREWHRLVRSEALFEVALDRIVAGRIRALDETAPKWTTIKGLKREDSDLYQQAALRIASNKGFARVHLDALWWGKGYGETDCGTLHRLPDPEPQLVLPVPQPKRH